MSEIEFIFVLIIILVVFYIYQQNKENFYYPDYGPKVTLKELIKDQLFNLDSEVAINPIVTRNCTNIKDKNSCLNSRCNWFGYFCSAMYPNLF